MKLPYAIKKLIRKHGSLRELSRNTGVDAGYLSHLKNGSKTEPSPEILRKLGLKKSVQYSQDK